MDSYYLLTLLGKKQQVSSIRSPFINLPHWRPKDKKIKKNKRILIQKQSCQNFKSPPFSHFYNNLHIPSTLFSIKHFL